MKERSEGNRAAYEGPPQPLQQLDNVRSPAVLSRDESEEAKLKALADARVQAYKDRKELEV